MSLGLVQIPSNSPTEFSSTMDSDDVVVEATTSGVFELIQRVGVRRLLFDAEHPHHKDRGLVENAWREVACGLKVGSESIDAAWCRKKWKKLTDYYRRVKGQAKKRSGDAGGKKITWEFYSAIDAIIRTCATENDETVSNLDDESVQSPGDDHQYQETATTGEPPIEPDGSDGQSRSDIAETPKASTSGGFAAKRKRKSDKENSMSEKIFQLLKDGGKDEDEEFHFCMNVAERLRKLSPRSNRKAQMKIQSLLFEIEFPDSESD